MPYETPEYPAPPKLPECVQMKHRIQQELDERYQGLSQEERRIQMERDILANPILGPLYERLKAKAQRKRSPGEAA